MRHGQRQCLSFIDHAAQAQVVVLRALVSGPELEVVGPRIEHGFRNDLDGTASAARRKQVARPLGDFDPLDVLGIDKIETSEAVRVGKRYTIA